ncbi:S-adenosyl-L-methionine-dependent methyltransferase [Cladochytrium replicatum]|nr:S-adenosyl-L-methionine-dependent methyltransferase [Cladochytrium replicatum]
MRPVPPRGDMNVPKVEADPEAAANWNGAPQLSSSRTYVKDAVYVFPTDAGEGGRQAIKHRLVKHMYGGTNYRGIPKERLESGVTVLDVGYGPGLWLSEMARDFPNGRYYGVDIVRSEWADAFQALNRNHFNVKLNFIQGDILKELPFPDNSFDYVHQRFFAFSIPANCWPHVISELHRVVKPGGWIDIMEQEPVLRNLTPRVQALYKAHRDSFAARGLDFDIPLKLDEIIRTDPRFELAEHERKTQTLYEDTEVSKLWQEDHLGWFESGAAFLTESMKITLEEFKTFVRYVGEDIIKARTYTTLYRTWARKV